ncbi:Spy/CpxP family protein refolding chaperone [Lacibacter sp.]|uniref:Spy/CpxP family protein refolding chaperone n=1 Tax=Lacibacter sp. TaxID=1915409 RepID=UPI002B4B5634|nr:periplasmic heavy metal sensor [Lacibacter sp.]HLP39063.1 periplasmic heavy metal sensor [Lacibacter sp.]
MNKTKFLIILVLLLLVLNAVTLFFLLGKKDSPKNRPGGGRPYSEYLTKKLNLDTAQVAQLKELRDKHKQELGELWKEDRQLQEAKFVLLKEGSTDSLRLDSLLTLIVANKKKFELAFHNHFLQIRALCRPDQVELFNNTLDEMKKRRTQGFGGDKKGPQKK